MGQQLINNYNLSMKQFTVSDIMARYGDLDCAQLGNEQFIGVFYSLIVQHRVRMCNY